MKKLIFFTILWYAVATPFIFEVAARQRVRGGVGAEIFIVLIPLAAFWIRRAVKNAKKTPLKYKFKR